VPAPHVALLHPRLAFSGATERMLATARALRDAGARVTLVTRPGSREHQAMEAGLEPVYVELPPEPWQAPLALARTRRALARLGIDRLHVTDQELAPLAATLVKVLRRPYVLEFHRLAERTVPIASPWLEAAVVASEPLSERVVNRGRIPRDRVRVIAHAPTPPAERAGRELFDGVPFAHGQRPRIGCSGTLDAAHNTDWFLEAARLLVIGGRPCHFVILAEGPREQELRRQVRDMNLAEHVTIGVPTTSDTAATMCALDVHVAPRTNAGPGWLALLALTSGVPSVLAAVGNAFDLVDDRGSAILVEPTSARRLADELASLLADPAAARTMGATGAARVSALARPEEFERAVAELHGLAPAHAAGA
jgi:glycosyltransferase involved in cell wall biosynthesis